MEKIGVAKKYTFSPPVKCRALFYFTVKITLYIHCPLLTTGNSNDYVFSATLLNSLL
jgi:hypothetical protein